jgi:hypothetical protein
MKKTSALLFLFAGIGLVTACGTVGPVNSNTANTNNNAANTVANSNTVGANANTSAAVTVTEAAEPNEYQATVKLRLEAVGSERKMTMPTLSATVARSGTDRRMEFTMPAGGRVVYLDKAGTNYLILPDRNQYAELDRESLGFDVRRLLMPEQIVSRVRTVQGVERVGEEKYNGRDVIKYRYSAVADTQSRAGEVQTESFLLVDKATGLPLLSEIVSQAKSGANVQGYSGVRVVTEITNVQTDPPDTLFTEPTNMQKVESDQIRAQADMVFNAIGTILAQMMEQMQPAPTPTATVAR